MGMFADPRPIHLLFERGTGFWAWAIRTFTKSKYAHVVIAFRDGASFQVLDVQGQGARIERLIGWRGGEFLWVPTEVGMTPQVRTFLFSTHGAKYDWLDSFRAAVGLQPRNQGYQCAEVVQRLFAVSGGLLPWSPTPQHILDQLRKFPQHIEEVIKL